MTNTARKAVEFKCTRCGKHEHHDVSKEAFDRWQAGELIQRAFPDLSPNVRESLKMNWCLQCVDVIYAEFERLAFDD